MTDTAATVDSETPNARPIPCMDDSCRDADQCWNRCVEVVPSGQDAPRTWRCWFPLPCPHHGSPDAD